VLPVNEADVSAALPTLVVGSAHAPRTGAELLNMTPPAALMARWGAAKFLLEHLRPPTPPNESEAAATLGVRCLLFGHDFRARNLRNCFHDALASMKPVYS
jgi:hypothetical protein